MEFAFRCDDPDEADNCREQSTAALIFSVLLGCAVGRLGPKKSDELARAIERLQASWPRRLDDTDLVAQILIQRNHVDSTSAAHIVFLLERNRRLEEGSQVDEARRRHL
ncbi:hypothetical protein [Nocardia sp. NPDC059228]|uniref:hypothetical protein n=1 Tax=Nocardia sp. NPDC059228 TaxID=3346777 RepID=UPI0036969FD9